MPPPLAEISVGEQMGVRRVQSEPLGEMENTAQQGAPFTCTANAARLKATCPQGTEVHLSLMYDKDRKQLTQSC